MTVSRDGQTFIHSHPLEQPEMTQQHIHTTVPAGRAPSTIRTVTGFAHPGAYKLWFQFQNKGEIVTVPFEFHVEPALPPSHSEMKPSENALAVKVGSGGFEPSRLNIPSGQPIQLAFTRTDAQNCASEILFPELGIRKSLPPGRTTLINLPAQPHSELHFACGMGMYRGILLVQ